MGRRNKKGRNITGIIVVDKPTGRSSNHVLQQVKRLFDAKKAGHTGNLDPLATGVLPICLGEATKVSSYLLDSDKQYQVTCQLGVVTDSGDSDGKVLTTSPVPEFTEQDLLDLIPKFTGEQDQVPPMFSALKYQGQPLYKLARQGIEVERKSRQITIYNIQLLLVTADSFTLDVHCSKGTYIRTLVEDISLDLGCGGHVSMLRRVAAAGYQIEQAVTVEQLEHIAEQGLQSLDAILLPTEDALPGWPAISVTDDMVTALRFGQTINVDQSFESAQVRLFDLNKQFLGLGEMSEQGIVAPKRVFVLSE
ncbi:MAG: tRNA pseudouridine(55) synthase TruB [Gammaproteobacteria bacterium]|nr:MAG: tRNA pseudouridine(55) synthase TruB [Gammaproteobacteria bacterium]RKZ97341.1 MAG: tRNA pseudouridine(55) synthase TruB [Gammaproteobacteria bacterium]